jgi:hypothetical protein
MQDKQYPEHQLDKFSVNQYEDLRTLNGTLSPDFPNSISRCGDPANYGWFSVKDFTIGRGV